MKKYTVYVTETLQREVEVEASSEDEALDILEQKYKDEEIVLDYQDLIDTVFSNSRYSSKEAKILKRICEYCMNECGKIEKKKLLKECLVELSRKYPKENDLLWKIKNENGKWVESNKPPYKTDMGQDNYNIAGINIKEVI